MLGGVDSLQIGDIKEGLYLNRLENIKKYPVAVQAVDKWTHLVYKFCKQYAQEFKKSSNSFVDSEKSTTNKFLNFLTHYNTRIDNNSVTENMVIDFLRDALFKAVESIEQDVSKEKRVVEAANQLRSDTLKIINDLATLEIKNKKAV